MNPKTKRSVNFTVIGAGEGGGRIADAFARLGYQAGAINTAQVDLNGLRTIPTSNHFKVGKGLGGAGLGLLTTKKIIQEHGGTIDFKSEPGEGTTFCIRLPRKRLPKHKTFNPDDS